MLQTISCVHFKLGKMWLRRCLVKVRRPVGGHVDHFPIMIIDSYARQNPQPPVRLICCTGERRFEAERVHCFLPQSLGGSADCGRLHRAAASHPRTFGLGRSCGDPRPHPSRNLGGAPVRGANEIGWRRGRFTVQTDVARGSLIA